MKKMMTIAVLALTLGMGMVGRSEAFQPPPDQQAPSFQPPPAFQPPPFQPAPAFQPPPFQPPPTGAASCTPPDCGAPRRVRPVIAR